MVRTTWDEFTAALDASDVAMLEAFRSVAIALPSIDDLDEEIAGWIAEAHETVGYGT